MLRLNWTKRFSPNSKFFKSLNFRIMVIFFLIGILPAMILSAVFLSAYTKQSLTRQGNDVNNQCQILASQLGSANYSGDPCIVIFYGKLMHFA